MKGNARKRQRAQGARLLKLLTLLRGEAQTSAALAEALGCTQQEIQRDLRLMRSCGYGVEQSGPRPLVYRVKLPELGPEKEKDNV